MAAPRSTRSMPARMDSAIRGFARHAEARDEGGRPLARVGLWFPYLLPPEV